MYYHGRSKKDVSVLVVYDLFVAFIEIDSMEAKIMCALANILG